MIRRIVLLSLATFTLFGTVACHGFLHRKKVSNAPSADVANEYRQRWIAKRVGDLTAGGMSAAEAESQASAEYAKKFTYLNVSK